MEYTVDLTTIEGIADSAYLDRLAEIVYGLPALVDPYLALNADGSVKASFCVDGDDPLQAASLAVEQLADALALARPLRSSEATSVGRFLLWNSSFISLRERRRVK